MRIHNIILFDFRNLENPIYFITREYKNLAQNTVGTIKIPELTQSNTVFKLKGKGIKESDINKVWDKYYKSEKKYKRQTIGTGIGLSIVKNIFLYK